MPSPGSTRQPLARRNAVRRILLLGAVIASLVLGGGTTIAALVSGALPTTAFTYTAVNSKTVDVDRHGIELEVPRGANVKTTYSRVAPDPAFRAGWHYHNGPVILTVTVGTLTYLDRNCRTWDLTAGNTYIERPGEVLNAMILPSKNAGIATVEWFTTRIYPSTALDPVPVAAPCTP